MNDEGQRNSPPPPLEYFSANEPARVRARGLNFWAVVLVVAWVPYLCGIVNASTVMSSYSPPIIAQHRSGALLFMGLGLMLAAASLIGFLRQRHAWGVASAALVVLVQLMLTACAGLATHLR